MSNYEGVALTDFESDAIMRNIRPWPKPTVEAIRNAVLAGMFLVPSESAEMDADTRFLSSLTEAFTLAVTGGRLFDLGHIPNAVIKSEAGRASGLFEAGHIGHPFREPYAFFHTWDAGSVGVTKASGVGDYCGSLYVVDPFDMHAASGGVVPEGTFLVCEAQAVQTLGRNVLFVGDAVSARVVRNPATGKVGYQARLARSALFRRVGPPEVGAASSLLDPIMSCLLLLATDGIEVKTVEAPERLNRQRAKAGKPAIPSHYAVKAGAYVTALNARTVRRSEPKGGHHASPVPHLRRGHIRHLPSGSTTWVRDAVINLKSPDAPIARSFYQRRLDGAA